MALSLVGDFDFEAVADDVEYELRGLDIDDLNDRAGSQRDGYTEPTDAAWDLLQEVIDPFLANMRRHLERRMDAAALEMCKGIVLGLYRVRRQADDGVLGWAPDFPKEAAVQAVRVLAGTVYRAPGRGPRRRELTRRLRCGNLPATAAPTPNPDGSSPAGSFERGKGESTPPADGRAFLRAAQPLSGGQGGAERGEMPMTAHRDLKTIIRERQGRTGESYTVARAHVMRERSELLGLDQQWRVEAIVLRVNQQSVRVWIPAENIQVTLRSSDTWKVVPGHLVTLLLEKRWTWKGDAYATGAIDSPRIDVAKLGLTPLPLHRFDPAYDLSSEYEPFESPDPYTPLWRKLTDAPRESYEMDPIAWGQFPDAVDVEDDPVCEAAALHEAGDVVGARALLMDVLLRDLRCIDAHAHLGNLEFDRSPERAIIHYEVGIRIGELSLPPGFDGVLLWGLVQNRPFLRCLNGHALCLWRLGRAPEAQREFERVLSLNPNDNQGVRFCWQDLREGRSWEEIQQTEETRASRPGPLS